MPPKEIRIDGVIGQGPEEISAAWVRAELPSNGTDAIRVSMHSEGGSVFEGFAIHDVFAAYTGPKVAAIESTAFSIASYIAMAFDEVEMSPNAYLMLHNPRVNIEGDDDELTKKSAMIADLKTNMVNAYASRTGKTPEEIQGILKAETYFNATDAVAFGLADRVTLSPIKGRAFAQIDSMPYGVVSALFGAGLGGNTDSTKGTQAMTESTPVAATIQQIKAAFPKAKAEFVLSCVEKSLPMASVATAAAEEMMKENEELKAQVAALQEEMAKAKACEDDKMEAKAEGDEEKPVEEEKTAEAKAQAKGVKPVAKGTSSRPSARVQWDEAVKASLPDCGGNKLKAVALASRKNPGLREAMLAEVNAR